MGSAGPPLPWSRRRSSFARWEPGAAPPLIVSIPIVLGTLIGAVTLTGSLVAFAKLQEIMTGRPLVFTGQQLLNAVLGLGMLVLAVTVTVQPQGLEFYWGTVRGLRAAGSHAGDSDRRRGHARCDLALELGFRSRRVRDRVHPGEPGADHQRLARRRLRDHPDVDHVQGHEPVAHERDLWRLWSRDRRSGRACGGIVGPR